jgi:adenylyltransferase/sulfurtransferase
MSFGLSHNIIAGRAASTAMPSLPPQSDRYQRQSLLQQIGPAGQQRLGDSRVLLVGCGALGCAIADQLARAGVGFLRIVDRDIVELSNLHRQILFDEEDARQSLPKAVAAANRLRRINSSIVVEEKVVDLHPANVEDLAGVSRSAARDPQAAIHLILDGTDNVETRYLLNDVSAKHGIPWVYGGCVGTEGLAMLVRPGGPCLRCVFPSPPTAGDLPTCDTVGVLGPAATVIGAVQSAVAIRWLVQHDSPEQLLTLDLWAGHWHSLPLARARRPDCLCCAQRRFEYLDSPVAAGATVLCGRDAVQVRSAVDARIDLAALAQRLCSVGEVSHTPYFVRCAPRDPAGFSLTIFADGRTLVHGTSDPARARSLAARFVGV